MKAKKPSRVRAAILTLLGVGENDHLWAEASSATGVAVTNERILQLSAAWACTRLISETIATLPLSLYEKTSAGKQVASQHPLHFILHDQPNSDTVSSVFLESLVASMLLRGNARSEKLMVGDRIVGLDFLHPDRLSKVTDYQGHTKWRYREANNKTRDIPADRIWHVPGFSLDGKNGVSVIHHGAEVFGAAIAAERAANSTWKNGLHPTTAWSYPEKLQPDQRKDARAAIKKLSGSVNAGDPVIIEAGMDVKVIGINPNDAQLLESRAFGVEEVCRWFRVPPFMVGHSEKSTSWGTGIEQQMIGFLTFTLGPWIRRIEQYINKDLLSPGDRSRYYAKFAVEGLLRSDSAARAAFYSAMVNNGIFTRDEIRELEDRPPMGGNAAVLTVQTALAPLDSLGKTTDSNAARAALQNWLNSSQED
ncbi:phage portal protein [Aquilutibacter rugosus]|uniref:phage portal protein n=1 Tax=Aquilutibacter rugosus TaxID=3115820 RepID=UPI002F3F65DB